MYYFVSQFRQVESCTDNGLYCQAYLDSRRPCILLSLEIGVLPGIEFVKKRIDFEPTKWSFCFRVNKDGNSRKLYATVNGGLFVHCHDHGLSSLFHHS